MKRNAISNMLLKVPQWANAVLFKRNKFLVHVTTVLTEQQRQSNLLVQLRISAELKVVRAKLSIVTVALVIMNNLKLIS